MANKSNIRIAWLVPISAFYWQHALSELTKIYPYTRLFTASWPGYAKGYESLLEYEVVGKVKIVDKGEKNERDLGYSETLKILSPEIVIRLFKYQPDVIFAASFGIWTILVLMFKFFGNWKVIISYEGSSPRVDYIKSPLRLCLRRLMVRVSDGCLTNTQSGQNYLVNTLRATPDQVFKFPHEVPSLKSLAVKYSNPNLLRNKLNMGEKVKFLFVGQIISRKGLQYLLEACQLLLEKGANNFLVSIIGEGPERQILEGICKEKGLDQYIYWQGKVNYDRLGDHFLHSDVFVLPTLEDTWGMVVLEAMLLGMPVLVSEMAGASELIIEGENGFTFLPSKPAELAICMMKILNAPELIVTMGKKSREIMADYSAEKTAIRLSQLIQQLNSIN